MPLMVGGRRVDRRLARHPPPSPTISIAVTITCTVSQLLCCVHFAPTVCLLIRYFTLYRRSIESRAAAGLPVRPLGWLNQSARREMTLGQLPARATFTFLIHSLVFQLFTRFSFLISLVLLFFLLMQAAHLTSTLTTKSTLKSTSSLFASVVRRLVLL